MILNGDDPPRWGNAAVNERVQPSGTLSNRCLLRQELSHRERVETGVPRDLEYRADTVPMLQTEKASNNTNRELSARSCVLCRR